MMPGRNQPCRCGSGKKYKLCHLRIEANRSLRNVGAPEWSFIEQLKKNVRELFATRHRFRPSDKTDRKLLALGRDRLKRIGAKLIQDGEHLSLKIIVGGRDAILVGDYAVGFAEGSEAERKVRLAEIRKRMEAGQ